MTGQYQVEESTRDGSFHLVDRQGQGQKGMPGWRGGVKLQRGADDCITQTLYGTTTSLVQTTLTTSVETVVNPTPTLVTSTTSTCVSDPGGANFLASDIPTSSSSSTPTSSESMSSTTGMTMTRGKALFQAISSSASSSTTTTTTSTSSSTSSTSTQSKTMVAPAPVADALKPSSVSSSSSPTSTVTPSTLSSSTSTSNSLTASSSSRATKTFSSVDDVDAIRPASSSTSSLSSSSAEQAPTSVDARPVRVEVPQHSSSSLQTTLSNPSTHTSSRPSRPSLDSSSAETHTSSDHEVTSTSSDALRTHTSSTPQLPSTVPASNGNTTHVVKHGRGWLPHQDKQGLYVRAWPSHKDDDKDRESNDVSDDQGQCSWSTYVVTSTSTPPPSSTWVQTTIVTSVPTQVTFSTGTTVKCQATPAVQASSSSMTPSTLLTSTTTTTASQTSSSSRPTETHITDIVLPSTSSSLTTSQSKSKIQIGNDAETNIPTSSPTDQITSTSSSSSSTSLQTSTSTTSTSSISSSQTFSTGPNLPMTLPSSGTHLAATSPTSKTASTTSSPGITISRKRVKRTAALRSSWFYGGDVAIPSPVDSLIVWFIGTKRYGGYRTELTRQEESSHHSPPIQSRFSAPSIRASFRQSRVRLSRVAPFLSHPISHIRNNSSGRFPLPAFPFLAKPPKPVPQWAEKYTPTSRREDFQTNSLQTSSISSPGPLHSSPQNYILSVDPPLNLEDPTSNKTYDHMSGVNGLTSRQENGMNYGSRGRHDQNNDSVKGILKGKVDNENDKTLQSFPLPPPLSIQAFRHNSTPSESSREILSGHWTNTDSPISPPLGSLLTVQNPDIKIIAPSDTSIYSQSDTGTIYRPASVTASTYVPTANLSRVAGYRVEGKRPPSERSEKVTKEKELLYPIPSIPLPRQVDFTNSTLMDEYHHGNEEIARGRNQQGRSLIPQLELNLPKGSLMRTEEKVTDPHASSVFEFDNSRSSLAPTMTTINRAERNTRDWYDRDTLFGGSGQNVLSPGQAAVGGAGGAGEGGGVGGNGGGRYDGGSSVYGGMERKKSVRWDEPRAL
ncbi:hypothetical protein TREMEDRAFT_62432 [Tremella mesenterica DSM 1558]|uniref:uncharacterized protein n=1 Tax=Tremella mesenterica (strain ATCC 24925 / CBS 8224 / DSM 1558 / NBRC 9311 / NRRL Y-6157 / RJB 2259-6 / UBC 559-6) TaxID=578456 RepID=UPI0003F4A095|nr:uncharacterized protein TREMEDRAFT_62432 [Tremella mesenterica DSM 1558]EIW69572.1 hypothetical protein TREMEDRAFT_62432 [Tremella mesenterica DSM 1558]